MKHLLKKIDGKIDQEIMHQIASDHGSEEDGTYYKSICQHPDKAYGILTCVSFIACPAQKKFYVYCGNPCKNIVKKYKF